MKTVVPAEILETVEDSVVIICRLSSVLCCLVIVLRCSDSQITAQCVDTVFVLILFDILDVFEKEGQEDGEEAGDSD